MSKEHFSEHYNSAAMAIGANGYRILAADKYKNVIARTVVKKYSNGLGEIEWQDKNGGIVAFHHGTLSPDEYPYIGEIERIDLA